MVGARVSEYDRELYSKAGGKHIGGMTISIVWTRVQNDLAEILANRIFAVLLDDPGYVRIFRNAGLPGKVPPNTNGLPPKDRANLTEAARMCAQLLTMHVAGLGSLRERRAKAVVLEGPVTIYRLWSQRQDNRTGPWWFTEGVLLQGISAGGGIRQPALEWLRDRLAISLDWSNCDRVAEMVLHPGNALPAVEAWGLPMPQYSKGSPGKSGVLMKDYWAKNGAIFQGQKTQYFLPFVPSSRVCDFW